MLKKNNILLLIFILFIVSIIITLNIFFQQSYQSEMAEQFNRQQLIIARSVASNIEGAIHHIEQEMLSFAKLLSDRNLNDRHLENFASDAFLELKEDIGLNLKIFDSTGQLKYSTFSESVSPRDMEIFKKAQYIKPGSVIYLGMTDSNRKLTMITPIGQGEIWKGVLILEVMMDSINKKYIVPIKAGIRGHAWMMDGEGTLLYHPEQPNMIGKNLYKADSSCFKCHTSFDVEKKIVESGDVGYSSYIAPYGEDKLIAFSKIKISHMSWIICVSIPYSEVTFSIRKSMKLHSMLVISIFIATVAGALSLIIANRRRIKAEERMRYLETQKSLEKEIIQTKDYLENILESTESKIMVLDRDMKVRTINSAHERLCGRKKDDVIGLDFFDVFPVINEDSRSMIVDILKKCLDGSSQRLSNYQYVREDTTLYLNININPLVLHGEVSGIIISCSDVTEEVSLKDMLREYAARLEELVKERTDELLSEKEKLNAIVETMGAGIFLVDEKRNITWVNKTLREWLGKNESDMITLDEIYGGNNIQRAIVDNQVLREVIQYDFGKKKGYFQLTSTPLISPDGHAQTLVLVQDITEMKKMEDQMMHSEKLSALARISAGVAHEIGNPLTSISSYVQILREMEHDDFTRESLETIAKHINRIADIVRQMSSFSRTAETDLKYHDIKELINMTLDLVRYDKRMKNIKINLNISETLPKVRANETQLIQVFMNIILNAADAMMNKGSLDIKASKLDHEVEVSFADTGPGIPTEHMERIFDPFFTTKEKGTGLGLAVSYNIIKSYQGDIIAENRPEGGTVFRVRLPYYET